MAVSKGLGTYGDGAGVVTPTDHKLAHLGLVSKTGAGTNTVRAGLFYDGVTTIVSGTANMSYDVAPFTAVSSRGAAAGAVFFANDGTVNVVTTAAPGTDSRIDVVYAWQREFSLDGGSTAPEIGVVQGTAAASPVAPSLSAYPGAIELARITVPAGVTATNSGTTITQTAPFTAAAGAPIVVRSAASLPATAVEGARARTLDTDLNYEWDGAGWAPVDNGFEYRRSLTFTASGTFSKASYPWLRAVRVRIQAAGGGSGGCAATGAGQFSMGGSGGGGVYVERMVTDIAGLAASETLTVGAAGAAGAAGANAGGAAADSAGFGMTAGGGLGGGGGGAVAALGPAGARGGLKAAAGTFDIGVDGGGASQGFGLTVAALYVGAAGASMLSTAFTLGVVTGAGVAANAGRSHGGGALAPANGENLAARAGAAGGPGLIVLDLFA